MSESPPAGRIFWRFCRRVSIRELVKSGFLTMLARPARVCLGFCLPDARHLVEASSYKRHGHYPGLILVTPSSYRLRFQHLGNFFNGMRHGNHQTGGTLAAYRLSRSCTTSADAFMSYRPTRTNFNIRLPVSGRSLSTGLERRLKLRDRKS